ncbi:tetratricopeptide repeat protein [Eisenibacter elegans]|jgi:tetratricopeptide (TPR) repeat protein|uniref:tetratricopeptide repeat protein n=1 Tax=Eisenibacter elegans TaxID=997 RepID=UPI00041D1B4A|nr:tetratricopeptide repeat protein [Eisenibacter elegans]
MEGLSVFLIFGLYIGIRLMLGHHKSPAQRDAKRLGEGVALLAQKQYEDALAYFEKALKQSPNSALAWTCKAQCHLQLQQPFYCLHACTKALDIDYTLRQNYLYKGIALMQIQEHEQALQELDKAVWHYKSTSAEALRYRGLAHYRLGNNDKAELDFKKAIQLHDEDANYYLRCMINQTDLT